MVDKRHYTLDNFAGKSVFS
uniref:Uncharacterized protein n=1 Tax=Anguilla anguilla TaxID=7936 RepID=A0A0E9UTY7_ANGAN